MFEINHLLENCLLGHQRTSVRPLDKDYYFNQQIPPGILLGLPPLPRGSRHLTAIRPYSIGPDHPHRSIGGQSEVFDRYQLYHFNQQTPPARVSSPSKRIKEMESYGHTAIPFCLRFKILSLIRTYCRTVAWGLHHACVERAPRWGPCARACACLRVVGTPGRMGLCAAVCCVK